MRNALVLFAVLAVTVAHAAAEPARARPQMIGETTVEILPISNVNYNDPTVAFVRFYSAVQRARSMYPLLGLLTEGDRKDLKQEEQEWPEKRKRRLELSRKRKKSYRPAQLQSPYDEKLADLKDDMENIIDVGEAKVDGKKAVVYVITHGNMIRNGRKLYRTDRAHMVREHGSWKYSHMTSGTFGYFHRQ